MGDDRDSVTAETVADQGVPRLPCYRRLYGVRCMRRLRALNAGVVVGRCRASRGRGRGRGSSRCCAAGGRASPTRRSRAPSPAVAPPSTTGATSTGTGGTSTARWRRARDRARDSPTSARGTVQWASEPAQPSATERSRWSVAQWAALRAWCTRTVRQARCCFLTPVIGRALCVRRCGRLRSAIRDALTLVWLGY